MNRAYDIHSTQSQKEILERLKVKTISQPQFKYLRWVKSAWKNHYYGVFEGYKFKLAPCIPGRNFCTPVIEGEILPKQNGCLLHYSVRLSPDMKMGYAMIGVLCCVYLIFILSDLAGGPVYFGDGRMMLYLYPFGLVWLLGSFSVLNHFCVKKVEKAIWKDFSTLAA